MQRANAKGARTGWGTSVAALALVLGLLTPACALSEQQQADQPPDGQAAVGVTPADTPGLVSPDGGAPPADGGSCVAETDTQLCAQYAAECGELAGFDGCGDWREVASCGACSVDHHCESRACVTWSYDWVTTPWSGCDATCGGGQRTRDVLCEREDGAVVADLFCAGTPPADTETCNTNPCVSCSAISAANPAWEVCETGPSYCAGVFTDGHSGTTCHDFCAAVGLPCTMRRGGEPGCIKESTTFACGVDNGHNSDWCECGTP